MSGLKDLFSPDRLRGSWDENREPEAPSATQAPLPTNLETSAVLDRIRELIDQRYPYAGTGRDPAEGLRFLFGQVEAKLRNRAEAFREGVGASEADVAEVAELIEAISDVADAMSLGARR